jgi:nucleotide-binding universal stress UspA family protein
MPDILVEHSVPAELHILPVGPRSFGETLLMTAHECGADMLVMGAFVHTPIHRLILGGVTQYMLAHSDLPVLMRH